MIKKTYKIIGLDCAGCAKTLERKLKKLDGIEEIQFNIAYKRLYLEFDQKTISPEIIKEKIQKSGYSIYEENLEEVKEHALLKSSKNIFRFIIQQKSFYTTIAAGLLLTVGVLLEFVFKQEVASQIVFIIATIIGSVFIFRKAFFSIKNLTIDINLLMIIAAVAALIIREEIEAVSIVFLFSIAEIAENVSIDRSKKSIEELINFTPIEAQLLTSNGVMVIPAKEVSLGETIIVKTGDRIPLDGIVLKGKAYINQASITGESLPVFKTFSDEVFAGTLCEDGSLNIKVTKNYENSFLRKIIELVENTNQRAPIERFVDVFAKYYTPIMFLIASLTLAIPPLITNDPFIDWVYKALVILVISCPCAVVLSTPITIVAAINRSAKNGVLIKGGTYIERLSKTKVVAFDKTGTLTIGHPIVEDIIPITSFTKGRLLQMCGSLEMNSKHPIAKAILQRMEEDDIIPLFVKNHKTITGKGVQGEIDGIIWYAGNLRYIQDEGLTLKDPLASELAVLQSEQKTVIIVGTKEKVYGLISVQDQLKEHAKGLIQELKTLNIEKTIMLTGDNSKTAFIMAQKLGIDEVYAELLPDEKMALIDKLLVEHKNVIMLGDGMNDAPALAHASVGIALGATGSDIALESADIALMTDSFDSLHYLFSISRKTMKIIIQNIIIAITVKIILFVLSYFGFITLWMAVLIGDMGVSLFVIFNALLRVHGKKMAHVYCEEEDKCTV